MSRILLAGVITFLGVAQLASAQLEPAQKEEEKAVPEFLGKLRYVEPQDDELLKLQIERCNAAHMELAGCWGNVIIGKLDPIALVEPSRRLVQAELDLSQQPAPKIRAWERHFALTQKTEKIAKENLRTGKIAPFQYEQFRYLRLDAEIELLRAKRQSEAKAKK